MRGKDLNQKGKIQADAEGYFHIIGPDGTDLGYEESYAAACEALEAWISLLRQPPA